MPSNLPTIKPTSIPSNIPSSKPSCPTAKPTLKPSASPSTSFPTTLPTSAYPSSQPTGQPSSQPSSAPSDVFQSSNTTFIKKVQTNLVTAVQSSSVIVVESIIDEMGSSELIANNYAYTSSVLSIYNSDVTILDVILKRTNIDLDTQGISGNTLLMWGCYWGNYDVVEYLLQNYEVNSELTNDDGYTALQLAMNNGYRDVVSLLRNNNVYN